MRQNLLSLPSIGIEVSKTSDGSADYVQIRSPGAIPVNIVLVANEITIDDLRDK